MEDSVSRGRAAAADLDAIYDAHAAGPGVVARLAAA